MAVVAVEAQWTTDDLLTDEVVAVGELFDHGVVLQFFDNLRVAGVVVGVDQVVGGDAGDGFRDAIAVAVVDVGDGAVVQRGEVVLEVVSVSVSV